MRDGGSLVPTGRFSPLRYPGGKGKLASFVAAVVRENRLVDGRYVEPYAGGASVAWELLLTGLVRRVEINDISRPIFAFWSCVLNETEAFCRLIRDCTIDVDTWDRCKSAFHRANLEELLELGFATFFLNRTNRSGILNGGIIGGRDQTGPWKIDARFNKAELIERIQRIALLRSRIRLTNLDAVEFLSTRAESWNDKTLVYLDPPYFLKGGQLYFNSYGPGDHEDVSKSVRSLLHGIPWIVSYDDVEAIRGLYRHERALFYSIGYSARDRGQGNEAMFFSHDLTVPPVAGSMVELSRRDALPDNDDATASVWRKNPRGRTR
ncbi:DNA adenine methylase [Mesorhizobium sp.]|uniref:DNA adenine methylase n=1 Tax=Mesorhizobium sp. TaxID=1871066 RepID=UPI00121E5153|nr:DNA adenine methylase [Mesorhizobium sp.]TIP72174.1 MAG: DNA adenine methylase [Mesorhizobium sp.]TJV96455.1 MAG: DNA adenine methylase [Mesorhizobium sp.]